MNGQSLKYRELGLIGRFQPPHNGHASLFVAAATVAERLRVGIGSVNRHDADRPYWECEVADMLETVIAPLGRPYRIIGIPDYGHLPGNSDGASWRKHMVREFRGVDAIVTGNPYVAQLLSPYTRIIGLEEIIPQELFQEESGTAVRVAIAAQRPWEHRVPPTVAKYLRTHGLDTRLRQEFGAQLLASAAAGSQTALRERYKVIGSNTHMNTVLLHRNVEAV